MNPADLDRVFGRGRLRMVTGEHVEVFREEAAPGERRRYTKRFLCTTEGDFRHWTEREWRILARLVGHGAVAVPEVLRFERGARGQPSMVQTYDAGVTVDHWTTLLPVRRDRRVLRHVFQDCAHWWALAFHALRALEEIHALQLVHLDLKADNICIPIGPADFDPCVAGQVLQPQFEQLALIDFAFALISGEPLAGALPIGHQMDHGYQSPRLLHALEAGRHGDLVPTRQLDWRCDIYSLAAMLRRYLPDAVHAAAGAWTQRRLAQAHTLVDRLFDAHHRPVRAERPHRALMDHAASAMAEEALADSLARGWSLAGDATLPHVDTPTPVTRIAMPVSVAAPAPGEPPGAVLARSGSWLRTVPLWVPASAEPAQHHGAPPAARVRAQRRPGPRMSKRAWLPGLVALVAAALGLVLPTALGPADQDAALSDAGMAADAAPSGEQMAALAPAPAASQAQPPLPEAGQAGAASAPAASAAATPALDNTRVAEAEERAPLDGSTGPSSRPDDRAAAASSRTAVPHGNAARHAASERPSAAHAPTRTAKAGPAAAAPRVPPRAALYEASKRGAGVKAAGGVKRTEPTTRLAKAMAETPGAKPPAAAKRPLVESRKTTVTTARAESSATASAARRSAVAQGRGQSASSAAQGESPVAASPAAIVLTSPPLPRPSTQVAPAAESTEVAQATQDGRDTEGAEDSQVHQSTQPAATDAVIAQEDFGSRAETLIAHELPRLAQRAERLVLRVLHAASISSAPGPDAQVLNAATAMQRMVDDALAAMSTAAEDARRLHAAAAAAFWRQGDAAHAWRLELRAFGADPRDPEVAGALAFYLLKQRPVQAEAARRLALLALSLPQPGAPYGRIEDWTTFAIASALAGRERDARNAWLVTLSLGPVDRQCRAAVAAVASHGAALRAPVEALLGRVREAGLSTQSPFCRWPPNWWAGAKAE